MKKSQNMKSLKKIIENEENKNMKKIVENEEPLEKNIEN